MPCGRIKTLEERAEKEGDMQIRLVLTTDLIPVSKPVRLALTPRGIVVWTDTGYQEGETWEYSHQNLNLNTFSL